jgi:hypothetical protein
MGDILRDCRVADMQEVGVSSMICPSNHPLISPKVPQLQHRNARRGTVSIRLIKTILLGNVWLLGVGLALTASPASAQYFSIMHRPPLRPAAHAGKDAFGPPHHQTAHASRDPFGAMPKGPILAIISIGQQRLHFYSGGRHIMDVPVATGVSGHLTPLGVFSVIQRDRLHHSNLYSNAPMPFMERITWSGVALHEGPGVGRQASHGCIRMPHDFAARLWQLPTMGMRVIIAQSELRPVEFTDPHLFVHKDKQLTSAVVQPKPIETAQTGIGIKTDAAAPLVPPPAAAGNSVPDAVQPKPQAPKNVVETVQGAAPANMTVPINLEDVPLPLVKPGSVAKSGTGPIAIFVSRKAGKIFVRQNFQPVFEAAVKIDHQERPLGTHVFTALDWLPDHSTLRWNVVSLPGEATRTVEHSTYVRDIYGRPHRQRMQERVVEPAWPPEAADRALARVDIPQDVIDQIAQLIVPGSSLVISDQGLGPETGSSGTDFIVVTR